MKIWQEEVHLLLSILDSGVRSTRTSIRVEGITMARLFTTLTLCASLLSSAACGTSAKITENATDQERCDIHGFELTMSTKTKAHPNAVFVSGFDKNDVFDTTITACLEIDFAGFACEFTPIDQPDDVGGAEDPRDNDGIIVGDREFLHAVHLSVLSTGGDIEEVATSEFKQPVTERLGKVELIMSQCIPALGQITTSVGITLNPDVAWNTGYRISCTALAWTEDGKIRGVKTGTIAEATFYIGL